VDPPWALQPPTPQHFFSAFQVWATFNPAGIFSITKLKKIEENSAST